MLRIFFIGGIFMEQAKIDRINELAKKQKEGTLSEEEKDEQAALRREYIDEWRKGAEETLENTYFVDENGKETKLKKKN